MRSSTINLNETETLAIEGRGAGSVLPHAGTVVLESPSSESVPGGPVSANVVGQGQIIDRYRIVRLIASGGMSRVYEAVHVFTHKTVALKVMRARFSERQDVISRFRHEAMALSSIRHQCVVNVENAGLTEDGHVFIAMEYLIGKNLREVLLAKTALGVRESLELVADVATGVAAAHAINVVHRDLKPENIFCVDGAGPKVLDLGTAKFGGDNVPTTQTANGKVVGTAAYIAPERLNGEPGDERCDVYSLGLVLYECIAGVHPMVPEGSWPNAAEMAARNLSFHPRPILGVSATVAATVSKAIHKDPQRRYRSMLEFSEAIRAALRSLEGKQHQPTVSRAPSWGQHALRLPIVAGIFLGAAFGGGVFRWQRSLARESLVETGPAVDAPPTQNSGSRTKVTSASVAETNAAMTSSKTETPLVNHDPAEAPGPVVFPLGSSATHGPGVPAVKTGGKPATVSLAGSSQATRQEPATAPYGRAKVGAEVAPKPAGNGIHTEREDLPASGL